MRQVTAAGLELVKHFEGFRAHVYICAGGYPTIGYGHMLSAAERTAGAYDDGIDRAEAEWLLDRDLDAAEAAVLRYIRVPLAETQFDALVSFTFNLGAGALQRSTLRRRVNRGEHAKVPAEFRRWVYAGGRKLAGLVRRRQAEARLYASRLPAMRSDLASLAEGA